MKNLTTLALLWLLALVPALAQTAPQPRTVGSFRAIEVGNGIELRLTSGQTQYVEASADTPELLARIKIEVRDGILKITFDREMGDFWSKKVNNRNLRVDVTAAALTGLQANSGANVEVIGTYATDKLDLSVSSGATLRADFTANTLQASVSSGGVATVMGKIQRLDVQASSGGVFKGGDLQAKACDASASSGGTVAVAVQESLTANASSGGDVRYSGSPQVTKRTSSGGSVKGR